MIKTVFEKAMRIGRTMPLLEVIRRLVSRGHPEPAPTATPAMPIRGDLRRRDLLRSTRTMPDLRRLIVLSVLCVLASLAVTASASAATLFTNPTPITIPAGPDPTSPYPSEIIVSGLTGPITDVAVTLHRFGHERPSDVDILIVSPSGKGVILMSDACGDLDIEDFTWTFTQSAPSTMSGDCANFTYQPTNIDSNSDCWRAPAPAGPYATSLSAFDFTNPNGEWRLFVNDDADGGTGFFTNRFELQITTDSTAPRVMSVSPAHNATGVGLAANVRAAFSEAMRATSINTVKLFKAGTTNAIGATVSYDAATKKATLNPNNNLRRGTKYKAVVTIGARDLASNRLDQKPGVSGNQSKVWFFTTRQ